MEIESTEVLDVLQQDPQGMLHLRIAILQVQLQHANAEIERLKKEVGEDEQS